MLQMSEEEHKGRCKDKLLNSRKRTTTEYVNISRGSAVDEG